ncbi:hypothetical protein HA62_29670 [Pseudomonas putida]|nr:hypothetical protein HA62_29670 [Pseudomonas putida]
MQTTGKSPATKNNATGALFCCGLFLIALAGVTFLFDWEPSGLVFCVGMVACMAAALFGEKASPSEIATLVLGATFFGWLILHNL